MIKLQIYESPAEKLPEGNVKDTDPCILPRDTESELTLKLRFTATGIPKHSA